MLKFSLACSLLFCSMCAIASDQKVCQPLKKVSTKKKNTPTQKVESCCNESTDNSSQAIVNITQPISLRTQVYKDNEAVPRYTLKVKKEQVNNKRIVFIVGASKTELSSEMNGCCFVNVKQNYQLDYGVLLLTDFNSTTIGIGGTKNQSMYFAFGFNF